MAEVAQLGKLSSANKHWESVPGHPYLRRHRASGIIHIRFFKAGRGRLEKTTGETAIGKANTKSLELIAEFLGDKPRLKRGRATVARVLDELLVALDHDFEIGERRLRTHENDHVSIPLLKRHFGKLYLDELDEDWWDTWARQYQRQVLKVKMKGEDPGRTTLFDVAKYLSKLCTFAVRKKYITRRPRFRNPDPAQAQTKPHVFSDEELEKIRKNMPARVLLAFVLGQECCFRISEAMCLEWTMVRFEPDEKGNEVAIINLPASLVKTGSTTGEGREVEVSDLACKLLREAHAKNAGASPFVFPSPSDPNEPRSRMSMWRAWTKAKKLAGITEKGRWFHHLRATFYTKKLLDERIDIASVSEYGGTSISTLQKRYLQADAKRTRHVIKG